MSESIQKQAAQDKHRVLIIEDDSGLQEQMRWCLDDCLVQVADSAQSAQPLLDSFEPQVVTLDLGLPPDPGGVEAGFGMLGVLTEHHPHIKVIVITGRDDRTNAMRAIQSGAYDYYAKPIDAQTLNFAIDRALHMWRLESDMRRLQEQRQGERQHRLHGLVAASANMLEVCNVVERVAPTDASVLILGETGTGKEVVASAIHRLSSRADQPYVAINCSAIPENLLESELFGYEKGAFTGASSRKIGKIETANGGTLLLDEIGDMDLALQAKILRFLQEREIERLGSNTSLPIDVRILSATHQNLGELVEQNLFRKDLYFRISDIEIELPPLHDRDDDALVLARYFLQKFSDGVEREFDASAVQALGEHRWPGNVRELEHRVKRATILSSQRQLTAADLDLESSGAAPQDLKTVRDAAEQRTIKAALLYTGGNLSETARVLGVSRPTLYNLLEKYAIKPKKR